MQQAGGSNVLCMLLQAQEQLTMKPSVAKKLNERIRHLEAEIDVLRCESKVTELEKKVQVWA